MKNTFILIVIFCFVYLPLFSQYSGTCGDNLTWTLDGGVLTISGTGDMEDYSFPKDAPWRAYNITKIIISHGVTSIGAGSFRGFDWLTNITIPNSVTSIGDWALGQCGRLTNITIPNNVIVIGDFAFAGCYSLTSITIPNNVTNIGVRAFSDCDNLTNIVIPNSVTSIGDRAFHDCNGLTSITIPSSVTIIGSNSFSNCINLKSIVVDAENQIYDSRDGCDAIIETASNTLIAGCQNTVIPNGVTSIGVEAFYGCRNLTSISIPNSVTNIGDLAFEACIRLTSITIPNSVTSIGDAAFSDCLNLVDIYVEATTPPILDEYSSYPTFPSTSHITIPCGAMEAYKASENWGKYDLRYKGYKLVFEVDGVEKSRQEVECGGDITSLVPKAADGYTINWDIDIPAVMPENNLTIKGTTATLAPTITVTSSDDGEGTVIGGGTYSVGDKITLQAVPNECYQFAYWLIDGANLGITDAEIDITVTGSMTYTAVFEPVKHSVKITTSDPNMGKIRVY